MNIFDTYDNLQDQYIPSNMNRKPCPPKPNPYLDPAIPKKPYEEYNAEGNLVGYWWPYGNTVNLEFILSGCVTIDDDPGNYINVQNFIVDKQIKINIYNFRHEEIDTLLLNGSNLVKPIYTEISNPEIAEGIYYIYENNKYKPVKLPENYIEGQTYYSLSYSDEPLSVIYPIDEAKSLTMEKGTYYCSLSIISKDLNTTVFFEDNCTLMVK